MAMPSAAGSTAALNQVSQGEAITTPSSVASFMHSRFCAAAVRNMALLLTLPWNWLITRKEPSLLDDASPVGGNRVYIAAAFRPTTLLHSFRHVKYHIASPPVAFCV